MYLSLSIRTRIACSSDIYGQVDKPLVWLNDCIDALAKRKDEQHETDNVVGAVSFDCLLQSIHKVITSTRTSHAKSNTQWLLELMGQIRSVLRTTSSSSSGGQQGLSAVKQLSRQKASSSAAVKQQQLITDEEMEEEENRLIRLADSNTAGGFHLLFDVFCLAVTLMAEVDTLLVVDHQLTSVSAWRARLHLLPVSVQKLVARDAVLGTQLAEWMSLILNADDVINRKKSSCSDVMNIKKSSCSDVTSRKKSVISQVHQSAMRKTLSSFMLAHKYDEGNVWGKLVL